VKEAALPPEGAYRRLHPTTLFHRAFRSLLGLGLLLLPVLRGDGPTARLYLVVAVVFGVLAIPGAVFGYLRFRYRLTPEEVQIESGVLARRHRSIPLDRIQRVEVDRPLFARAMGTARVRLMTGSGAGAEGVLDFVALPEALALRETVRQMQREREGGGLAAAEAPLADSSRQEGGPSADAPPPLHFGLTPGLLFRAGAMRFSLVYIALAFSGLQLFGFSVVDVVDWIEEADLLARVPLLTASPLLALAVSLGVAFVLSWVAGLVTTLVRYHGFTLRADARRLYTERGLGGRFERAIPREKVQAVLFASNPITRAFGYARLEVQTMGLDDRGGGREVLIPLAPLREVSALGERLLGYTHTEGLRPVSSRFVRRRGFRYSVLLGAAAGAGWLAWEPLAWGLVGLPLVWALAWRQWRAHGFRFDGSTLVVQGGALWRQQWHLPLAKFQTVDRWANMFQRRQGLGSVYVDTAGAPDARPPVVEDLPEPEALALADTLYAAFEGLGHADAPTRESAPPAGRSGEEPRWRFQGGQHPHRS
jgi:putative membrane protein